MLIPKWPVQETQETLVQSLSQEDPGEGNGTPVQYPCLKNSMDKRKPGRLESLTLRGVGHG